VVLCALSNSGGVIIGGPNNATLPYLGKTMGCTRRSSSERERGREGRGEMRGDCPRRKKEKRDTK